MTGFEGPLEDWKKSGKGEGSEKEKEEKDGRKLLIPEIEFWLRPWAREGRVRSSTMNPD